jgi:MurNAc alpha-1-phosphate uridylyltransferase
MDDFFINSKIKNILLVVNKKLSFDKQLKGDFNLQDNRLTKRKNNDYIYTGCQIFSRDLLNSINKKVFSIIEIWNELINKNILFGFESKNKFYHVSNLEVYNKLLKNY